MAGQPLAGAVALVTGAGGGEHGGYGAGITRSLARAGATVVVNEVNEERAQATVAQLQAMGAEAWVTLADVSDPAAVNEMVRRVIDRYGHLDILVNNAAIGGLVPAVERMPDEIWLRQIAVDLSGPFFTSRAVLPHMMERRRGRIVNIASVAAWRTGFVGGSPYTTSKAGLLGLTRHLALEVMNYGITVNAILPTGRLTQAQREAVGDDYSRAVGRLAGADPGMNDPEDVGHLVVFLCSEDARQINGAAIPVDGGASATVGDFYSYRVRSGKDAG